MTSRSHLRKIPWAHRPPGRRQGQAQESVQEAASRRASRWRSTSTTRASSARCIRWWRPISSALCADGRRRSTPRGRGASGRSTTTAARPLSYGLAVSAGGRSMARTKVSCTRSSASAASSCCRHSSSLRDDRNKRRGRGGGSPFPTPNGVRRSPNRKHTRTFESPTAIYRNGRHLRMDREVHRRGRACSGSLQGVNGQPLDDRIGEHREERLARSLSAFPALALAVAREDVQHDDLVVVLDAERDPACPGAGPRSG